MKKASLFASAAAVSALALTAVPALADTPAAGGQGPFADVPAEHWAYESVQRLQNQGIVIGYPDGTYGGRRAMTRYEFAVAIARLLDLIGRIQQAPSGPAGITEAQLTERLRGFATQAQVDELRRLVTEFQNELTTLGVDLDAVRRRLDNLEGRVANIENEMKRVRISGAANLYARVNQGRGDSAFIDYDGFLIGTPGNNNTGLVSDLFKAFTETRVLHDIDLNIDARLGETANARVKLNFGNYLPFLNSIVGFDGSRSSFAGTAGAGSGTLGGRGVNQTQEQTVYQAYIEAPIRLPGLGGVALRAGRIPAQFTPYTLRQIDTDSYFSNDKTDLGDIPVDGAQIVTKLGPIGITGLAAKVDPIKHVSNIQGEDQLDNVGYGLYAGATFSPFVGGFQGVNGSFAGLGGRPVQSSVAPGVNGAMAVENIAAIRATFGAPRIGTVGASYIALGGEQPGVDFTTPGTLNTINRVYVYGADLNTTLGPVALTASYTQSDSKLRVGNDDLRNRRTDDNYAYDIAGGLTFGGVDIVGGYRYIKPYFAAPGYWGKLGSWVNPVDIRGPYIRADYAFAPGLALTGEGHFYEGTGTTGNNGGVIGLGGDDGITNFKVGLKYGLTAASAVDLGVEYTTYDLATGGEPKEIFYNLGFGYSFSPVASLKLLYQLAEFDNDGSAFGAGLGDGAVAAAQFSVKF